jgi:hypothetical protein
MPKISRVGNGSARAESLMNRLLFWDIQNTILSDAACTPTHTQQRRHKLASLRPISLAFKPVVIGA